MYFSPFSLGYSKCCCVLSQRHQSLPILNGDILASSSHVLCGGFPSIANFCHVMLNDNSSHVDLEFSVKLSEHVQTFFFTWTNLYTLGWN